MLGSHHRQQRGSQVAPLCPKLDHAGDLALSGDGGDDEAPPVTLHQVSL